MLIRKRRGWELAEGAATPEHLVINRRALLSGAAALGAGLAAASPAEAFLNLGGPARVHGPAEDDPTWPLYPVARNERYTLDRPVTEEAENFTYNNFYEFGTEKTIARKAQALRLRPWQVRIDGLVETERTIGVDELIKAMPLEERLYRHRCVEAWAMAIPWSGFALKSLVDFARPLGSARYLRMETFLDASMAPGQKQTWYPWPYVEGLTMAEAVNELAFIATGCYGKPLPKQMGAPIRLAVPWKYGFKSIKSVVRFSFTEERPVGLWEAVQPQEYGFWANVNPEIPHPRWSQASERMLGTDERIPTQLYNGYAPYVADLYRGLVGEGRKLFM